MIRPGHVVMLCAVALLTLGVIMVSSAGMSVQPLLPKADPAQASANSGVTVASILLSRSAVYMALAVAAMALASLLPVRRLAHRIEHAPWATPFGDLGYLAVGTLAILAVLALVYVPGIEREVNGANRWINLRLPGLESVQPSELAKWAIVPLIAFYAARLSGRAARRAPADATINHLSRFFTGLLPALVCIGAVSAFIVVEDLGTGFLVALVACLLLLAGGAKLWQFAMFIPLGVLGVVVAIIESPYRLRRITSFLDPYADPQGDGYHMIQSMVTVAGGGFAGRGLGHGLQKFGYLPEDTTDFLFAVLCEETGFAGAALVTGLYAVLLWTSAGIVRREPSVLLKLTALGILATVGVQACINLVVVTGLGPTKGIALPLLSAGGTGWILTALMLGVICAIDRAQAFDTYEKLAATDDPALPVQSERDLLLDADPTVAASMIELKPARRTTEPA